MDTKTRAPLHTPLCDLLGIRYPICQAGMAFVARSSLAAAVSAAGGLGVIAAAHGTPEHLREEIRRVRDLTDQPFGVDVLFATIRTVGEAFPGRFIAGLGVSHPPLVEARGEVYERPLAMMRRYLEDLSAVKHYSPPPAEPPLVVLAALRPKMVALAATHADGAHPYFVPAEHTARARAILGPGKLLAPELAVVLETDPTEARRRARQHTSGFYLQAPNYVENLRWLGFGDDDFDDGGSDALVDAVVAWGNEDAIAAHIREHLDAGVNHVCIQPVTEMQPMVDGLDTGAMEVLRRLADAVCQL